MVSFVCNYCQATLKKPKLDQHAQRCREASFSCIDCNVDFVGTDYRQHTSCMTEEQKYKSKMTPNKPKPKSTVEQLQAKQKKDEETKRKQEDTSHQQPKEKKSKKSSSSAWNESTLPKDELPVSALVAALEYTVANEPSIAPFKELRKHCVKLVTKHPQSDISKQAAKDSFDQAVIEALSKDKLKLRV